LQQDRQQVQCGDETWRKLVGRFRIAVRRCLERYGGREIDTAGDGFFVTFEAPGRAPSAVCSGRKDKPVTLASNSHALTTPPSTLATAAGISQHSPPPAFSRKVSAATPISTAVIVLGENPSMYGATPPRLGLGVA